MPICLVPSIPSRCQADGPAGVPIGDRLAAALRRPSRRSLATTGRARDTDALVDALDVLAGRVDLVHLHVDLDVHDPSVAPANSYAAADGLSAEQVRHIVRLTADRLPIVAATLALLRPDL